MKAIRNHTALITWLIASTALYACGPGTSLINDSSTSSSGSSKSLVLVGHHFSSTFCGLPPGGTAWCSAGTDGGSTYGGSKKPGVPIPILGISGTVTSVSIGLHHTCAVVDGAVQCFGRSGSGGELGNGSMSASLTPVTVADLGGTATAVAVGVYHSCALLSSGAVKCWGSGYTGDGTGAIRTSPVSVSGLSGTVTALATGQEFTCALLSTGAVQCWGANAEGQLGDGTTTQRYSAVTVSGLSGTATAIAAGVTHACALLSTGAVQCWGDNSYGQIGDGTTTQRQSPVTIPGLGGTATAIAAASFNSCALLSTGGLRCWGNNTYGQIGDGTTTQRTSPTTVAGLSGTINSLAVSYAKACALLSDNATVLCWGLGAKNDGSNSTSPIAQNPNSASGDATALAIFSSPTTATANGDCFPVIAATTSATGGLSSPVSSNLSLTLTKTTGTFYSNNTCTSAITTTTLPSGANAVQFFYKGTSSPTIGVSGGGLTAGSNDINTFGSAGPG